MTRCRGGTLDVAVRALSKELGTEKVLLDASACEMYSTDGLVPRAVVFPSTENDVVEVFNVLAPVGARVGILGGRTRIGWGRPLEGMDVALVSTNLKGEIDLRVDDLTVSAPAGTSLAELNRKLASQGLFLPLDHAGDSSTVGGSVASAASSFQRPFYGTARDMVLGMRAVLSSGHLLRFGGRTVKNVSGYDVCKLLTGSWGSLACITGVTFRVYAFPPASGTVAAALGAGAVHKAVQKVFDEPAAPCAFEVFAGIDPGELVLGGSSDSGSMQYVMLVRFSGPPASVEAQCRETVDVALSAGATHAMWLKGEEDAALWSRRLRLYNDLGRGGFRVVMSAPPGEWGRIIETAESFARANRLLARGSVMPLNGVGVFEMTGVQAGENHTAGLAAALAELAGAQEKDDGYLAIQAGPIDLRREFFARTSSNGGPARLLSGVKRLFDPGMMLNPGKMP